MVGFENQREHHLIFVMYEAVHPKVKMKESCVVAQQKENCYDLYHTEAKEKYRGVFEIQRSGDKTSSGEIGLDIRTDASPKVGQDQVSGRVSVLCWHAAPVAYVLCLWKPYTIR